MPLESSLTISNSSSSLHTKISNLGGTNTPINDAPHLTLLPTAHRPAAPTSPTPTQSAAVQQRSSQRRVNIGRMSHPCVLDSRRARAKAGPELRAASCDQTAPANAEPGSDRRSKASSLRVSRLHRLRQRARSRALGRCETGWLEGVRARGEGRGAVTSGGQREQERV